MALSSSPTPVVSNLDGIGGLAVDSVQHRIWWTTAGGLIESAGFDGAQRATLPEQSVPLTSVDVFEDFVYALVPSDDSLLKVNKFARDGERALCEHSTWHTVLSEYSSYCTQCTVNTVHCTQRSGVNGSTGSDAAAHVVCAVTCCTD